jgi:hypothetical protein
VQFVPLVLAMYVAGTISGATGFGVGIVGSIALAVLVGPKVGVVLLSRLSRAAPRPTRYGSSGTSCASCDGSSGC